MLIAQATSIIYSHLEPTYQVSVAGSLSAADMWTRLNQEHSQVAAVNAGQLTAKFFQYVMDPALEMKFKLFLSMRSNIYFN